MARANLVNLESVGIARGITPVLAGLSLGVQSGDRIGVLGLNGSGKSTLLAVLGGRLAPDTGRVATGRDTSVAFVDQTTVARDGATVRDTALSTFTGGEHTWASDGAVRGVLDGLGLTGIGLDSPMASLSGGEQRRVALAAALVTDADLLILDEPTNHLDIEGIGWLAEHLINRSGALVAVTHDRWFLDAVAAITWEVVDERVEIREGGYTDWVFARAERLRLAGAAQDRRKNLARKELAWLRRGAPARTSKPRFRIEAAEALIADEPEPRNTVQLHSFAQQRLGKDVLEAKGLTLALPAGRVLLDTLTWRLGPGDRVGIVGGNGSGKSTLLRALVDDPAVAPLITSGLVQRGSTVRLGYLSQDPVEVPAEWRLVDAVADVASTVNLGGKDLTPSQLAERFGFTHAQQWTKVGDLSGGQRRRLHLLRILMDAPNVLVLDEPTNDLDTDTLTALEDVLDSWPGTLVVVSHDRYLVERITDDVYALFGDGRLTHLPGGVDSYLARRDLHQDGPVQAGAHGRSEPAVVTPAIDAATQRELRKQVQRLDRQLESLQRKQNQLRGQLERVGSDFDKASRLDAELQAVMTDRESVEHEWLVAAEALEG